jgi:hypothetical protein
LPEVAEDLRRTAPGQPQIQPGQVVSDVTVKPLTVTIGVGTWAIIVTPANSNGTSMEKKRSLFFDKGFNIGDVFGCCEFGYLYTEHQTCKRGPRAFIVIGLPAC